MGAFCSCISRKEQHGSIRPLPARRPVDAAELRRPTGEYSQSRSVSAQGAGRRSMETEREDESGKEKTTLRDEPDINVKIHSAKKAALPATAQISTEPLETLSQIEVNIDNGGEPVSSVHGQALQTENVRVGGEPEKASSNEGDRGSGRTPLDADTADESERNLHTKLSVGEGAVEVHIRADQALVDSTPEDAFAHDDIEPQYPGNGETTSASPFPTDRSRNFGEDRFNSIPSSSEERKGSTPSDRAVPLPKKGGLEEKRKRVPKRPRAGSKEIKRSDTMLDVRSLLPVKTNVIKYEKIEAEAKVDPEEVVKNGKIEAL